MLHLVIYLNKRWLMSCDSRSLRNIIELVRNQSLVHWLCSNCVHWLWTEFKRYSRIGICTKVTGAALRWYSNRRWNAFICLSTIQKTKICRVAETGQVCNNEDAIWNVASSIIDADKMPQGLPIEIFEWTVSATRTCCSMSERRSENHETFLYSYYTTML